MTKFSHTWYIERFEESRNNAAHFLSHVRDDQFLKKPSTDVWSVAECFDHINAYNKSYLAEIEKTIVELPSAKKGDVFIPRFIWKKIVDLLYPPSRVKLPTIKAFEPSASDHLPGKEELLAHFLELQDRYLFHLNNALHNNLDLSIKSAQNPVFRFIPMRLSECFAIVDAHERRHIWQARQILKYLDEETDTN